MISSIATICLLLIIFILPFHSCNPPAADTLILNEKIRGFWRGPHPELKHVNFIFHISSSSDEGLRGMGFWVNNGLYQSEFTLDSITLKAGHVKISVPDWECWYEGEFSLSPDIIAGQFCCPGEPPDSVLLERVEEKELVGLYPKHLFPNGSYVYRYRKPLIEENGFTDSSLIETGLWRKTLEKMVQNIGEGKYGRIHSFILIKNGELVCEEYFYGFKRDILHPLESVTKSITCLLIGIASDQNQISNMNDSFLNYFRDHIPEDVLKTPKVRIRHLLTMTSGLSFEEGKILSSRDRIKYLLQCGSVSNPGTIFSYNSGNTELLGAIIRNTTGFYADEFAKQFLFESLGITEYRWDDFRQNGYPLCGGALWLRPLDMAKIGLMVLQNGKWQGKQVVSEKWIEESITAHVETGIGSDRYGYQWWISDIVSGNQSHRLIWANGMGSQFIFIFPELDMIIVTTGGNWKNGNNGRSWDIFSMFTDYLLTLHRADN